MKSLFLILSAIPLLLSCDEKCEVNPDSLLYYTYEGRIGVTNNSSLITFDDRILISSNLDTESVVYKIEKNGDLVWRTICDANTGTLITGIAEHSDQTIFACGITTRNNPEEPSDILLIHIQANGDTLWSKTIDVGSSIRGSRIVYSKDQNILIASTTEDPVANAFSDFVIVKTDKEGNELWKRFYPTDEYETLNHFFETHDGGFILTGSSTGNGQTETMKMVKINSEGVILWTQNYGPESRRGRSTIELENGELVSCGDYNNFSISDLELFVMKTNSTGDIIWEKRYGEQYGEIGEVLKEATDGDVVISGYVVQLSESGTENFIMYIDRDGKLKRCHYYKDDKAIRTHNLLKDRDESLYITGWYSGSTFLAKLED